MENITHQGNIIEVIQEEVEIAGRKRIIEYARRSPGVRLIIRKNNRILITKEFRRELQNYDYRLPGGKVYDSLKEYNQALLEKVDIQEAAKDAAIKEAHEEAGIEVKDISFFHRSICGATVQWDLFYFTATDFSESAQTLEEGEDIAVQWVDIKNVEAMCMDGRIGEERSALVLLRYLLSNQRIA